MFRDLKTKLGYYQPKLRTTKNTYILDNTTSNFFNENGYVVLRNVLSDGILNQVESIFHEMSKLDGFEIKQHFTTSPNYGKTIQQYVHTQLQQLSIKILPLLFRQEQIQSNLLNIFVIKYPNDNAYLLPHNDVPFADELMYHTTFVWFSTTNTNEENGTMMVLPKSHLWAYWQRTHSQFESPYIKHQALLLEHMITLELNKGDVLLFDAALIHASKPNKSNATRIAVNIGVVDKDAPLIHYVKSKNNDVIEQYNIDTRFWLNCNYMHPNEVDEKYFPAVQEYNRCPKYINKKSLKQII